MIKVTLKLLCRGLLILDQVKIASHKTSDGLLHNLAFGLYSAIMNEPLGNIFAFFNKHREWRKKASRGEKCGSCKNTLNLFVHIFFLYWWILSVKTYKLKINTWRILVKGRRTQRIYSAPRYNQMTSYIYKNVSLCYHSFFSCSRCFSNLRIAWFKVTSMISVHVINDYDTNWPASTKGLPLIILTYYAYIIYVICMYIYHCHVIPARFVLSSITSRREVTFTHDLHAWFKQLRIFSFVVRKKVSCKHLRSISKGLNLRVLTSSARVKETSGRSRWDRHFASKCKTNGTSCEFHQAP